MLVLAAAIGIFESLLSRYLFGLNELYIGSLLILFAVVVTFVKYPTVKYPSFINALSGCSTYVYIFHIMIASVISKVYKMFYMDANALIILKYAHPFIVCIASTVVAYGIVQITKAISLKKAETRIRS